MNDVEQRLEFLLRQFNVHLVEKLIQLLGKHGSAGGW